MRVFDSVAEWLKVRATLGPSIGLVPTMGALHCGHGSLLTRSVAENDVTVLTIYINPTQFNNPSDLTSYPRTLQQDLAMARDLNVDYVLTPHYREMYADGFRYQVEEKKISHQLCGRQREGHFTGVLTVVLKLLNMVRPTRAYFGEKDYQQYVLIRDMCEALFMPVQIVACATIREPDGLAMSSRNRLLDSPGRVKASFLHRLINSADEDSVVLQALSQIGFSVDYVITRGNRRFVAAALECDGQAVRLIDNVLLPPAEPRSARTRCLMR